MAGLKLVTGPTIEPLTTDEAKKFVRVDHAAEDDQIDSLIKAGRERCERVTGRALLQQTWRLSLDTWPSGTRIKLPRPPAMAITHVKYYDVNGTLQTVSTSYYSLDTESEPGVLEFDDDFAWPATNVQSGAVQITYTAGYGDERDDVPNEIRERLKNYVAYCFEKRIDRDESFLDRLFEGFHHGELT